MDTNSIYSYFYVETLKQKLYIQDTKGMNSTHTYMCTHTLT